MKFLVDNQLPPALARFISDELRTETLHVVDIGLRESSDAALWNYASANGFVLISKEDDFATLYSKTPSAALAPVSIVLADESPADFQRLLDAYLDEFAPTSPIEVELVETMASARWRLRRLANIETTLLANEMETSVDDVDRFFANLDCEPNAEDRLAYVFKRLSHGASLHLLNRYEGTINRSYAQAFKQLHLLRSLRIRVQPNEPKQSLQSLQSLPVEPTGDRVEPSSDALCASVPDRVGRPGPIPPNKTDDRALPARPPVLQIPSTPKSLPVEPQATGASPIQRPTMQVPTYK